MAPLHCTPGEAIEIHKDVGAMRSLAMHWGTVSFSFVSSYSLFASLLVLLVFPSQFPHNSLTFLLLFSKINLFYTGTRHAGMSRYYMDAMEPKKEFLRRREEMLEGGDEDFAVCEIGETVVVNISRPATTTPQQ